MNTEDCAVEITTVADIVDEKMQAGWAYWQFKKYAELTSISGDRSEGFYEDDGTLHELKVRALSRTYVKHAQGTILNQTFS